ncbi:MAG TPA: thiamine pyrophosphate-dependent enzyme [Chloroflexia bacterium]|nr:thiamine pyrophosphate-dependent enzyme [Chloroflexia bacterium]
MIELETAVKTKKASDASARQASSGRTPAEELLEERRDYYRGLVSKVFAAEASQEWDKPRKELAGLSLNEALAMYTAMRTSREIDLMMQLLQRTGNLWFSIAGAGKEIINAAFAAHMRPDDYKLPYYRDQTLALWSGISLLDILRQSVASRFDPQSGGRQMSSHFGSVEFNFPTGSTMTGSQCLPAAGAAAALKLERKLGKAYSRGAKEGKNDTIVYTSLGDGTTSEGEVEEAIRDAVRDMSPIVFVILDDEWAISTPVGRNVPGGSVSRLYSRYQNLSPEHSLEIFELDGTDFVESYTTIAKVVEHCRSGKGPALVHAHVTRPMSHSSADTQAYYRSADDLTKESGRDPLTRMIALLAKLGVTEEKIKELDSTITGEVRKHAEQAVSEPKLDPATITHHITSTPYDLQVTSFREQEANTLVEDKSTEPIPMRDLITRALIEEMKKDERIVIFGQDVADFPIPDPTGKLKGKGGVFHVTRGVGAAYPDRVWNAPLAEATILGTAMGYSLAGFMPVIEIQFRDYIHPGWQQLVDEIATQRWRSNGTFACPMVIRVAYGDFLGGAGAIWHSEAGVGPIAHYPGLRVVVPSLASDAVGLLRESILSGDPVVFLEPKSLYEAKVSRSYYPGPDYRVPLGSARVAREGSDLTIVTYGNLWPRSMAAADKLAAEYGINAEVIDLRTVDAGYDRGTILKSLKKTGYIMVVDEDRAIGGFGSSVAAEIASNWWHELNGPIGRIHPKFSRVSYGPAGEKAVMPNPDDIVAEALRVLRG